LVDASWPVGEYPYTRSLLALAACTLVTARAHQGEWDENCYSTSSVHMGKGLADDPDRELGKFLGTGIRGGFHVGF